VVARFERKNIQVKFRAQPGSELDGWSVEPHYDRLPGMADELVGLKVDVLVTHGAAGALAAKRATSTIPIVVTAAGDFVALVSRRACRGREATSPDYPFS